MAMAEGELEDSEEDGSGHQQSPYSAGAEGPGEGSAESEELADSDAGSGFGEGSAEGSEDDEVDEEEEAPIGAAPVAAEAAPGEQKDEALSPADELLAANARCTELQKELDAMIVRKDALERCAAAQERELSRLRKIAGEDDEALQSASASASSTSIVRMPLRGSSPIDPMAIVAVPQRLPLSAPTPHDDPRDYAIAVIMPKNFDKTPVPYNFKKAGQGFPHRVQERSPGKTRQYVVESRLVTTLELQLCKFPNMPAQRHATEAELPFRGLVRFRLVPCLASTGMPLETSMFRAGVPDNFFSPPIRHSDTQVMKNGRLTWSFKPTFLSRNTRPVAKQEVFFRITCVEPLLADYNLETETERVLVVARETRKRQRTEE